MIVAYGLLGDVHLPYESSAYELALKCFSLEPKLKGIVQVGDWMEILTLSRHPKHPDAVKFLKEEYDYGRSKMQDIRKRFDRLPIHWVFGNHENRVDRWVQDKPELHGMNIDIPSQLQLDELKISWAPYKSRASYRLGQTSVWVRHKPIGSGRTHSKATAEKAGKSVIYGHTHTYQEFMHKTIEDELIRCTSIGWLGDETHDVFDYRGDNDNWSKNCGILYFNTKTLQHYLVVLDLNNGDTWFQNRLVKP